MNIITAYATNKGPYRSKNQDNVICLEKRLGEKQIIVACVCDGIGSLENSEISSEIMVKGIERWIFGITQTYPDDSSMEELVEDMELTLCELNEIVHDLRSRESVKTGCTMSLLLIIDRYYYIFHAGDSRIYSLDKSLVQLTTDEVVTKEVNGKTSKLLSNFVGKSQVLHMEKKQGVIQEHTLFLIASDGVYKKIWEEDLRVLKRIEDGDYLHWECNNLLEKMICRGERDNLSCAVILFNCN